ncbi:MAG TPA: hypothetical protein VMB73_02060 [Acetobacteraceae bacterium]|jgi:hypothetical protein|nr:hypothetical protein [Acetobacteraceae bacterium]
MYWCLGMYASASTWTYNVVKHVAATLLPDKPVLSRFVADALPTPEEAAANTVVVKTHAATAYEELARRATAIIVTIRDPRDAIASLLTHNKPPFEIALNVTEATAGMCGHFMSDPRALALKFEDRFFDRPATVARIAARFPDALPDADAARIFAALRRDAVDSFIANLETLPSATTEFDEVTGHWDTYDPLTGWHKHHAGRTAEIGRWRRELTAEQVVAIEQRLGPWMMRFGYAPASLRRDAYTLRIGRYGMVE